MGVAVNDLYFSLNDFIDEIKRRKKKIVRISIAIIALSFAFLFIKPVTFTSQATFKEEMERQSQLDNLKDLFGGATFFEPQAAVLMRSKKIIKPLIHDLGLQAKVNNRGFLQKVFGRLYDNFSLLLGGKISDRDPFIFSNVYYDKEIPSSFTLSFTSPDKYLVFEGKKELGEGKVGDPFYAKDLQFTLKNTPQSLKIGKKYPLTISAWMGVYESLQSSLSINTKKENKSILTISYRNRDRNYATKVVNHLMYHFKSYLEKDQEEQYQGQIAYLEKRENDFYEKWNHALNEHVKFVQKNLKEGGFADFEQRLNQLMIPHQLYAKKLFDLELEDSRLQEKGPLGSSFLGEDFKNLHKEKEQLAFSKQLLDAALFSIDDHLISELSTQLEQLDTEEKALANEKLSYPCPERKELITQKKEIEHRLESSPFEHWDLMHEELDKIAKEKKLVAQAKKDINFLPLLGIKIEHLSQQEIEDHFTHYEDLLALKEKIVKEKFFALSQTEKELEGVDLDVAKSIFAKYQVELDQSLSRAKQFAMIQKQLQSDHFEPSSLVENVTDPISKKSIEKVSQLRLAIQDRENRSDKEITRLKEDIDVEISFLKLHIAQMEKVEKVTTQFLQKNIHQTQTVILDRINQKISALEQQEKIMAEQRKNQIAQEKKLLTQKMADIRKKMEILPEQWHQEIFLKWKSEMSLRMMQAISQMIESKTMSSNLQQILSKPLDEAIAPLAPDPKWFFLTPILSLFLAWIGGLLLLFIIMQIKGFTPSLNTLQAMKHKTLGILSKAASFYPFVGQDLETLRQTCHFIISKKKVALFCRPSENISFSLCELLAKKGYKILLLSLDWNTKQTNKPGVVQLLKENLSDIPTIAKEGYDYLPWGGLTNFGYELITSKSFTSLIEKLEKKYEIILFHSTAPIESIQAKALLSLVEKAVVCYKQEKIEALQPYMEWGYNEPRRVGFIKAAPI